jgi:hypothetical protein
MKVYRDRRIMLIYKDKHGEDQAAYIVRDICDNGLEKTCSFLNRRIALFDGCTDDIETIDGAEYTVPTFYSMDDFSYDEIKRALHFQQRPFYKTRVSRETSEVKHG